jgi:hypothetical protein
MAKRFKPTVTLDQPTATSCKINFLKTLKACVQDKTIQLACTNYNNKMIKPTVTNNTTNQCKSSYSSRWQHIIQIQLHRKRARRRILRLIHILMESMINLKLQIIWFYNIMTVAKLAWWDLRTIRCINTRLRNKIQMLLI